MYTPNNKVARKRKLSEMQSKSRQTKKETMMTIAEATNQASQVKRRVRWRCGRSRLSSRQFSSYCVHKNGEIRKELFLLHKDDADLSSCRGKNT